MSTIKSFEEIEAWKNARELNRKILGLTKRPAFAKDFGLKDQISRSSVSVMSNIAEGYESQTKSVFIRHLGIAKGSCGELRSQLYSAFDQGYIEKIELENLCEICKKVSRQIARFKQYLQSDQKRSQNKSQ
jgi:four helix bundle protein